MLIGKKTQKQLETMKNQLPELKEHKSKLESEYRELIKRRMKMREQLRSSNDPQLRADFNAVRNDTENVQNKLTEISEKIQWIELLTLPKLYMNRMGYTDIHPYEVIKMVTLKTLVLRPMKSVETQESKSARIASFIPGGFCGHTDNSVQQWHITPDESVDEKDYITVRMHKDGFYYDAQGGIYIMSENPRRYYDFNF